MMTCAEKARAWGIAALVGAALAVSCQLAGAASIVDQGWCVQADRTTRMVELQASVVNDAASAQSYQVRFTMESCDSNALAKSHSPGAVAPVWSPAETAVTDAVSVPAGASTEFTKRLPYEKMMGRGKAYRFQAELLGAAGDVVAKTAISAREVPYVETVAGLGGLGLASLTGGAAGLAALGPGQPRTVEAEKQKGRGRGGHSLLDTGPVAFPSGQGTMEGTQTAQRVGGQWVEHGVGVIRVHCSGGGIMTLNYTYDSSGPNAAALSATAQGSGNYVAPNAKGTFPVTVSTASANMTFAGDRTQTGSVITRTHAQATGTFTATVGDQTFTGVLTISKGTETLDLATGQGTHSFAIRFTTR